MRNFIQCVSNANEEVTPIKTINAIKDAGFDGVFIQWYKKEQEIPQENQYNLCKKLNFEIPFFHLGYSSINNIWLTGKDGDDLVDYYINDLNNCKKRNINLVVMHLTSKSNPPEKCQIGIDRLKKIVKRAEELDIKIAFENTKVIGYLEYVFEHIKSPNIGICYDAGHDYCHFDSKFNWDYFNGKILAVHLHDNDKSGDQHLLPFDGSINWECVISNLKKAGYTGPIILESCYRRNYLEMSVEEFYKESFKRAKKLEQIFSEKKEG